MFSSDAWRRRRRRWRQRRLARALVDQVWWTEGDRLLEIGDTAGAILEEAGKRAALGAYVAANRWDARPDEDQLSTLVARATAVGIEDRLAIVRQEGLALPLATHSCTVAISVGGFDHLRTDRERIAAGRDLARVLTAGGTVLYATARYADELAYAFGLAGMVTGAPQRHWWSTWHRLSVVRAWKP